MRKELQAFIDEMDYIGNFAGDLSPSGEPFFDYMALKAVANLFGGNVPTKEILIEVYSELQRMEVIS